MLLPIHVPLMQHKIVSQSVALEFAMKLEASPVGENGAVMMQIQPQLANIKLKIQNIKKGKEIPEEIWCTICIIECHHKYSCPTFLNYLASGVLNLINSQGIPWCRLFQIRGHW